MPTHPMRQQNSKAMWCHEAIAESSLMVVRVSESQSMSVDLVFNLDESDPVARAEPNLLGLPKATSHSVKFHCKERADL